MANLEERAYRDVRTMMVTNWNVLNIYNSIGEVVYTKKGFDNSKVKWTHTTQKETVTIGTDVNGGLITAVQNVQSNPNMQLTVSITGADLTLPSDIASFELTTSYSYDTSARIKDTLDTIVEMKLNADTFVYKMDLKVGV
ncbi:MAG: hypothetical protein RR440_00315 [Erysipelotrichaceae bacterium]